MMFRQFFCPNFKKVLALLIVRLLFNMKMSTILLPKMVTQRKRFVHLTLTVA